MTRQTVDIEGGDDSDMHEKALNIKTYNILRLLF